MLRERQRKAADRLGIITGPKGAFPEVSGEVIDGRIPVLGCLVMRERDGVVTLHRFGGCKVAVALAEDDPQVVFLGLCERTLASERFAFAMTAGSTGAKGSVLACVMGAAWSSWRLSRGTIPAMDVAPSESTMEVTFCCVSSMVLFWRLRALAK